MTRQEFIKEFQNIHDRAMKLGRAMALARETENYPESEMGITISEEGVYFYDLAPIPYEDYQAPVSTLIPWRYFDEPNIEQILALKAENDKVKRQTEQERFERETYEKLRKKFENGEQE